MSIFLSNPPPPLNISSTAATPLQRAGHARTHLPTAGACTPWRRTLHPAKPSCRRSASAGNSGTSVSGAPTTAACFFTRRCNWTFVRCRTKSFGGRKSLTINRLFTPYRYTTALRGDACLPHRDHHVFSTARLFFIIASPCPRLYRLFLFAIGLGARRRRPAAHTTMLLQRPIV